MFTFFSFFVYGQGNQIFECEPEEYVFTGDRDSTLCDKHVSKTPWIEIGAGTDYEFASSLSQPLSGVVWIIGDFFIDVDFEIADAIIYISATRSITVDVNKKLSIDASLLYSCEYYWKGIKLGYGSKITITDSEIEDAEAAINSSYVLNTVIQAERTIFNRNIIGIKLIYYKATVKNLPIFSKFSRNKFTCTSPLFETVDGVGLAGIYAENVPISFGSGQGSHLNEFDNLIYGIYSKGYDSFLRGRQFRFSRIKQDGIYLEYGSLYVQTSQFHNCEGNGIHIGQPQIVDIRNNEFIIDDQIPATPYIPPTRKYRNGILLNNFEVFSKINLENNLIDFNQYGTTNAVRGIHLKSGGDVRAGTMISIIQNEISICAQRSAGIFLDGNFSPFSNTLILYNDFICSGLDWIMANGIESIGDKNNLYIHQNTFSKHPQGLVTRGIFLNESKGINIEISDNIGSIELGSFYTSVGCDNAHICSNIISSTEYSNGFSFSDLNFKTTFGQNIINATGAAVTINRNSIIGIQEFMVNEWHPIIIEIFPNFFEVWRATYHARCRDCNEFFTEANKFFVHTEQSVWDDEYIYFSPYHPENVDPDVMDEFMEYIEEYDLNECSYALFNPDIDSLDYLIASMSNGNDFNSIQEEFELSYALYKFLSENPSLPKIGAIDSFYTTHQSSNIGSFHSVYEQINGAFEPDSLLGLEIKDYLEVISDLNDAITDIDNIIDTALNQTILDAALSDKLEVIDSLKFVGNKLDSLSQLYKDSLIAKFTIALTANNAISTNNSYEYNLQFLNRIYLYSHIYQEGQLTNNQVDFLLDVLESDPDSIKSLAHYAYILLPDCLKNENYIYLDSIIDFEDPLIDTIELDSEFYAIQSQNQMNDKRTTLEIAPNPSSGSFTISSGEIAIESVTLIDLYGKVILQKIVNGTTADISLNHFAAKGVYLIKVTDMEGDTYIRKVIVK